MTEHQPADPETPLSDAEHRLGQVRMKAGSMAEDRDETVRRCGKQMLAVLGDAALPVAAVLDRTERDMIHADLGQLLEVLGLGNYARPESPHEVMQQCIAKAARLRDGARMLGKVVVGHSRTMEAARIEDFQNGANAGMQWILNSLPDVWDDPETAWDGKESANEWFDRTDSFYRAAESHAVPSGEAGAGDDTGRTLTGGPERSQERPWVSEDFRELIVSALDGSIDLCARCKVWHEQVDAVMAVAWPLLEHAQFAAAGSHEGIRLWMLDCGELVAKHRERADEAEAKLAAVRDACRSIPSPIANRILATISTEGDEGHG